MKSIKQLAPVALALLSVTFFGQSAAKADQPVTPPPFLNEVRQLLDRCTQVIHNETGLVFDHYDVLCPDEVMIHPQGASHGVKIILDGQLYFISSRVSPNADGGDLTDIRVEDSYGRIVLNMRDVLAYHDPIYGIVGDR